MNILLDTHIALWAITSFEKIGMEGQKILDFDAQKNRVGKALAKL